MFRVGVVVLLFLGGMAGISAEANAQAQDDPAALRAIVERLRFMQSQSTGAHGLWIRHATFELSRHDVRHSFRNPVKEWSPNEKAEAATVASRLNLPVQFCREECGARPDSIWTVAIGTAQVLSADQIAVPVQVEGSEGESASYKVVYEMILNRSPRHGWVVSEVLPGASSDSISCQELFGHSCEEERRRRAEQD
jgi:hypothetical protein